VRAQHRSQNMAAVGETPAPGGRLDRWEDRLDRREGRRDRREDLRDRREDRRDRREDRRNGPIGPGLIPAPIPTSGTP
jgi:hypothetical protein